MKEKNKKMWQKWLLRIIFFFISIILLWFGFRKVKPLLVAFFTKNIKLENELAKYENTISIIFGILNIIVSIVISTVIPAKIEKKQILPQILIVPVPNQVNGSNVSGVKKERPIDVSPRIELGESQSKYRIIYAKIVNTGKIMISECSIKGQIITFLLAPNDDIPIYLIFYDYDKEKPFEYKLEYFVRDINDNSYKGVYCMQFDLNKVVASFHVQKKLKRSKSNNAL